MFANVVLVCVDTEELWVRLYAERAKTTARHCTERAQ